MLRLSKHTRHAAILAGLLLRGSAAAEMPPHLAGVDQVVVHKSARTLTLYAGGRPVHIIEGVQFGKAPVGPKRVQGDKRTPEGRYTIDWGNPESSFYLSIHVSYPNQEDIARAAAAGRDPGGMIMIHGQPNGWPDGRRVPGDWTDGCIAVSNAEMDLLWEAVPDGATIDILP